MAETATQSPSGPEAQPQAAAPDAQLPPKRRAALGIASVVIAILAAGLLHAGLSILSLSSVSPAMLWAGLLGGLLIGMVLCVIGLGLALTAMVRKQISKGFVLIALLANFVALGSCVLRWVLSDN